MTIEDKLKEKENEMKDLLQVNVDKLDEEIDELQEELDELKKKRSEYQKRINSILGISGSSSGKHGKSLRLEIISILEEAGGELSRTEIITAVKDGGREVTNNHLGTVLAGMKKSGEIINTEFGKYSLPVVEKEND